LIFNIPIFSNKKQSFDLIYYFDLPYEECLRRQVGKNDDLLDTKGYFQGNACHAYIKAKKEAFG
jgi:hypothetical protein